MTPPPATAPTASATPPAGAWLDPFAVLGLPPDPDLTDDQVHAAWHQKRQAVSRLGSTGDAFHVADAIVTRAYVSLRSAVRRAEALDDLTWYWDTNDQQHTNDQDAKDRGTAPSDVAADMAGDVGGDILDGGALRGDGLLRATAAERAQDPEAGAGSAGAAALGLWAAERSRMPRPRQPEERIDSVVPSPERREELRRIVAEQRRKQGLPPFIEDEAVIAKIVDILLYSQDFPEERQRGTQRSNAPNDRLRTEDGSGDDVSGAGRWQRSNRATSGRESVRRGSVSLVSRIRRGRPAWLVARIVAAVGVPVSAYVAEPSYPSWIALSVGALTWLGFTARYDLAPASANDVRRP